MVKRLGMGVPSLFSFFFLCHLVTFSIVFLVLFQLLRNFAATISVNYKVKLIKYVI